MEFIIKTLRTLFFSLDKVIYGLIDDVYGLLLQLTRTSVFTQESIHQFAERVYALVGIFMLFKVTVSLVNYVLNPDDFADKEKGLGSIVKHVILSLVMIVLVPYIFNEAFELQSIILEENTIMNLIFGSPSERELNISNSSYTESAGQKIQFTIMYAFAQPNYDDFFNDAEYDLADCKVTYKEDEDGNYTFRKTPVFDNVSSEDSNFIYSLNESCWGVYDPNTDTYVENGENGQLLAAFKSIDSGDVVYQNYAQGVAQQSFNMFFRQDVILAKEADGPRYFVDYKMGLSTAVGVGTLYLLLMFCIDIALRSVKLGFLQMIAPIPILSYCDPKSGKDGMFKKWTTMCVKTYLDLFIRLFALYFGIYAITLIGKFRDVATGEIVSGWLVSIFMIIGILIFAKKLPEILKESLGLDGGTFKDFKLNPLKRIEEDALGGKRITGAVAGTAMGVAGMMTGAGFGRGLSGAWHGIKDGKGWSETLKNQRDKNAAMRTARLNGSTFGGRLHAGLSNTLGTRGEMGQIEKDKKRLQTRIDEVKAEKERAEANIAPSKTTISRGEATASAISALQDRAYNKLLEGKGIAGAEYQRRMREQEKLKTRADALAARAGQTGNAGDLAAAEAAAEVLKQTQQNDDKWAHSTGRDALLDEFLSGTTDDDKYRDLYAAYQNAAGTSGHVVQSTASTLDNQNTQIAHDVQTIRTRIAGDERQIADYDDQIKVYNDKMQDISRRESVAKANQDAIK